MSDGLVRVSVGTRFIHDGELMQVVETQTAATGTVLVLRAAAGGGTTVIRATLRELLDGSRARLLPDDSGPQADDDLVVLGTAGTGRTTMATLRAEYLAPELPINQGLVLSVTHNIALGRKVSR